MFSDKSEAMKGLKAKLYFEKDATSIFCKSRTVIYALRAVVNEELQSLQNAGHSCNMF